MTTHHEEQGIPEQHARLLWNSLASANVFAPGLSRRARQRIIEALEKEIHSALGDAREACAAICDKIQQEANERYANNADPGEGSDGAYEAAKAIRALTF